MLSSSDTLASVSGEIEGAPPRPGELWDNRYLVGHTLGSGGMSVVMLATDTVLGREVALKCLYQTRLSGVPQERFMCEARTTARLQSEHTVRIYDIGTCPRGTPYLCLELLHGTDLASLLRARGALCLDDALLFVLQACEALAEAHALGIVHRDLKPSNLFLTCGIDGSACIKVIDFGIATHVGGEPEGLVLGSPLYMAPEQLMNPERIGIQTDIWALGLVLCELATGRMPFEPSDRLWWLAASHPPLPPSVLRPGVPSALDAVLRRCLSPDPNARYASVEEFSRALAAAAPDSCPDSTQRISRITNVVRESQRPLAPARGALVARG